MHKIYRIPVPCQGSELQLLSKCKKKISVELNYTSQMARYIRSETGIGMDAQINKYDGEPFTPSDIAA